MSEYEEYKPKKPRNLGLVLLGVAVAIIILVLIIIYFLVADKQTPVSNLPDKISIGAGGEHSNLDDEHYQTIEQIELDYSDYTPLGAYDVTAMTVIPEVKKEKIVAPELKKIITKPVSKVEAYKPAFVATPESPEWMVNAVTTKIDPNKPMVAIVIDDLGIDKRRTQKTIDLPAPLTLAFLPYPSELLAQTSKAREAGHELIVHMPMEPSNLSENNPGPDALLTSNKNNKNLENLKKSLEQFDGYVGVNNHMGSRFTSNYDAMGPVLEELKRRGLLFLDSRTIGSSKAPTLSEELDLPFVSRDVFLDHDPSRAGVDASLAKTARVALKKGTAIAIGHPKDSTIAALKAWIPQAKKQGIQIVPLTAIAHKRMGLGDDLPVIAKAKEIEPSTVQAIEPSAGQSLVEEVAEVVKGAVQTQEQVKAITVTVGEEKTYDGIIWNEPAPTLY